MKRRSEANIFHTNQNSVLLSTLSIKKLASAGFFYTLQTVIASNKEASTNKVVRQSHLPGNLLHSFFNFVLQYRQKNIPDDG